MSTMPSSASGAMLSSVSFAASSSAAGPPGLRFQTTRVLPCARRFLAIGRPMMPSPMNPTGPDRGVLVAPFILVANVSMLPSASWLVAAVCCKRSIASISEPPRTCRPRARGSGAAPATGARGVAADKTALGASAMTISAKAMVFEVDPLEERVSQFSA